MPESIPLTDQHDVMQVERRITTIPVRAADATWQVVSEFIVSLMQERERSTDGCLESSLARLHPLASFLLVMHKLRSGWIEFDCGDLQITFRFDYSGIAGDEDLSLPPLSVLGPHAADTPLRLAFCIDGTLEDGPLCRLIESVNTEEVLRVSLSPEPTDAINPPADTPVLAPANSPCDQGDDPEGGTDVCHD